MEEDTTYTSELLVGSMPGGQQVLGVSWNPVNDMLEFDIRGVAQSLQSLTPTKQNETLLGLLQDSMIHWGFWHLLLYS